MLAPVFTNGPGAVTSPDRRAESLAAPSAAPPTGTTSRSAVPPPPEKQQTLLAQRDLPSPALTSEPAEPADLIATLTEPRSSDVEPVGQRDAGPFGPPPAFEQSPLQAQRARFPDPPPEAPVSPYSALQRLETPFDTSTVNIAR